MPGLTTTQGPRTCRGGGLSPQHGRSENLGSAGSGLALDCIRSFIQLLGLSDAHNGADDLVTNLEKKVLSTDA